MRWTIARRIILGSIVFVALALLVVLLGVLAVRRIERSYDEVLASYQTTTLALHAESDFGRANIDFLGFLLNSSDDELRSRERHLEAVRLTLEDLARGSAARSERDLWERARAALVVWDESCRSAIDMLQRGQQQQAWEIRHSRTASQRDAVRELIQDAVAMVEQRAAAARDSVLQAAARDRTLLAIGGLLAVLVAVASAVLLVRAVNRPLHETSLVLASTAAEILAATTQQAAGASQTATAVAETVSTVEEVAQTAEQAAQRARSVSESADRASQIGAVGREAVDGAVHAMNGLREQVEGIAESILALAEQAQAIGEIIATVNDIAEQTNLLSLNAAVEAARAGEHGRGFAVVASEVKVLADQSKKATVQVRQILGEIQRATSKAVMTTEQGTARVGTVATQIREAGETIRELVDAVARAAQSGSQILASTGQQNAGMRQVQEAMASIRQAMQQNLASTRQSERAARDLHALGARLMRLVGGGSDQRPDRGDRP